MFTTAQLTGDDLAICQDLADQARAAHFDGVIAPSSAAPTAATVAVFFESLAKVNEIDSAVTPAPPLWRLRVEAFLRRLVRR